MSADRLAYLAIARAELAESVLKMDKFLHDQVVAYRLRALTWSLILANFGSWILHRAVPDVSRPVLLVARIGICAVLVVSAWPIQRKLCEKRHADLSGRILEAEHLLAVRP